MERGDEMCKWRDELQLENMDTDRKREMSGM